MSTGSSSAGSGGPTSESPDCCRWRFGLAASGDEGVGPQVLPAVHRRCTRRRQTRRRHWGAVTQPRSHQIVVAGVSGRPHLATRGLGDQSAAGYQQAHHQQHSGYQQHSGHQQMGSGGPTWESSDCCRWRSGWPHLSTKGWVTSSKSRGVRSWILSLALRAGRIRRWGVEAWDELRERLGAGPRTRRQGLGSGYPLTGRLLWCGYPLTGAPTLE